MTPLERADRAKQLLADPLLNGALESIRAGLVATLEDSGQDDVETHHTTALSLQLLKQIKVELHKHLSDFLINEDKKRHETFIERTRQTAKTFFR